MNFTDAEQCLINQTEQKVSLNNNNLVYLTFFKVCSSPVMICCCFIDTGNESHLVPAGEQLVPGGAAQRLDVVVLQTDPVFGQFVQVWGPDLGLVIAHIMPAEVIRQHHHDVGLFVRGHSREPEQEHG